MFEFVAVSANAERKTGDSNTAPWHSWELDTLTVCSVFNPNRTRLRACKVTVKRPENMEEDPSVETFRVTMEVDLVVLHL